MTIKTHGKEELGTPPDAREAPESPKRSHTDSSQRQRLTEHQRDEAAEHQSALRARQQPRYDVPAAADTPDERAYPKFAASFHKLFEHHPDTGLLTPSGVESYQRYLAGLRNSASSPSSDFDESAFNEIELATPADEPARTLINPRSSKALSLKGGDIAAFRFDARPIQEKNWELGYEVVYAQREADTQKLLEELSFGSSYSAAEMVEVYAMALLRDSSLGAYSTADENVGLALAALNAFGQDFRGPKEKQGSGHAVTPRTLFRGNSPESLRGDYLSKFLVLKRPPLFASGCSPSTADLINAGIFFEDFAQPLTAPQPNPDREFLLSWPDYVAVQNRRIPQKYQVGDFQGRVPISTGRNLASLVHVDGLYEEYAFAVDVLTAGNYRRTRVSPYTDPRGPEGSASPNEGDGPTLGPPDAAGLVGAVALEAARLAWSQKYLIARRARPEVFGALVHKRKTGGDADTYGKLDARLLSDPAVNKLLERVKAMNAKRGGAAGATYLLSQVFPEASPAHPAWPSGHATIAGACVTVIKAIFDDREPVLQQTPERTPFTDEKGKRLTVGGELDKLASNIALGRNFGGVHFRSDGEHGILLGEQLAIRFLQDHLRTYRERFHCKGGGHHGQRCFELGLRSGQRVHITPDDVDPA